MYIGGHLDLVNTIFSWFSFSFIKRKGKLWEPTYPAADSTECLQKTVEKNPDHGLSRLRSQPEGPVYYRFGTRVSSPAGKWEALSNMVWPASLLSPRQTSSRFTRLKCSRRWKKRGSCSAENEGLSALRPKIVRLFYFYNSASRRMPRYIRVARETIKKVAINRSLTPTFFCFTHKLVALAIYTSIWIL